MRFLVALVAAPLALSSCRSDPTVVTLRAGQTRTIAVPMITRVEVRDPRIADVRTPDRNSAIIVGVKAGETTIAITSRRGTRSYSVVVEGVAPRASARPPLRGSGATIELDVGSSRIVALPRPVTRIAVANPRVADLVATTDTQFTVVGVDPGRTEIRVVLADGAPVTYRVNVR